jgi:hypothetical protein
MGRRCIEPWCFELDLLALHWTTRSETIQRWLSVDVTFAARLGTALNSITFTDVA